MLWVVARQNYTLIQECVVSELTKLAVVLPARYVNNGKDGIGDVMLERGRELPPLRELLLCLYL